MDWSLQIPEQFKGAFRPVCLAPSCHASTYASLHATMRASSPMPLLDACACLFLFTPG
jgi:hypothetical protein